MALTDSGEDEGGFVVLPRSHIFHRQYFIDKKMENHKSNWFLVPEEDKEQEPFNKCLKVNS